jgi:hypothetical protein
MPENEKKPSQEQAANPPEPEPEIIDLNPRIIEKGQKPDEKTIEFIQDIEKKG